MLLADVARHVARVYAHEKLLTEDETLERIRAAFEAEMQRAARCAEPRSRPLRLAIERHA